MSSLPANTRHNARQRANATFFDLLKARPTGTQSPENAFPWRKQVRQNYLSKLSRVKARTASKIIDYISYRYRLGEYTAQFTYIEIANYLHISTKTVQRYIHELINHRLLAVVRSGKSAAYAQSGENEAPIYTLLTPLSKNVHPLSIFKKSVKSLKDKKQKFPPLYAPKTHAEELLASVELKKRVIDLRSIPTKLLAKHLKRVFDAGWCLRDIIYALEYSADGTLYLTRGAGGMNSVLAWLHIRLNAWKTTEGTFLPSRTSSEQAEAAQQRKETIARQESILKERNKRVEPPKHGLEKIRMMREFLKAKNHFGLEYAASLYPEQAQLVNQ